ncbi:MAG: cytochrome C oxidase subunit IV family protein [Bacteroidota bacterium]
MENEKHHIVPFKTYGLILLALIALTFVSVAVTRIELTRWSTAVALLIATVKVGLVLTFFMHLKFDQKIFRVMVPLIFLLLIIVIVITFLDYLYR